MVVSNGLKESDFRRSEVFKENGVDFFPEKFLDIFDRLGVVPVQLLDEVADAVVPFLQIIVKQSVLFGLKLVSLLRQLVPRLLVVGLNV